MNIIFDIKEQLRFKLSKFLILFLLLLTSCVKPKSVLICGDHECINRAEAKQYFEENLIFRGKDNF